MEKTKEEVGEIFRLFKDFVHEQRPQLDIDKVATGETWFGTDAVDRNLADALQTFDDVLLELHGSGIEVYSVAYKAPEDSPLSRLKVGSSAFGVPAAPATNWATRLLAAALGRTTILRPEGSGRTAAHQPGTAARERHQLLERRLHPNQ